jgi:type IV secretion system protein VirB3
MSPDTSFEVPVHRSLTQPIMFAGLPRNLGLLLWTVAAAFALGLHQLWMIPLALVLHALLAVAAKRDPYFFDVFMRAVRGQRRLDP